MSILNRGDKIGKNEVQSLIKANQYVETYRVVDEDGNPLFLKLFILKRTPEKLIDKEHNLVIEIEIIRLLKHKNIISYISDGELESIEGRCLYYLTDFLSGELLADKIKREGKIAEEEAMTIFKSIIEGLNYMHNTGLCHNDITPRNIMLPSEDFTMAEIIDFGHASERCGGTTTFDSTDLEIEYCANETFAGIYDEQSDIFSATAVLYAMLTGTKPWSMDFPEEMRRTRRAIQLKEKRKKEPIDFSLLDVSDRTRSILAKGLAVDYHDRYKDTQKVLQDLDPKNPVEEINTNQSTRRSRNSEKSSGSERSDRNHDISETSQFELKRGGGNGFKDIAGMAELKKFLTERVIFVIKNKEMVERYRITPPNGMLFYGPPGCGKTFMAEKFAEETGFNFILVKSSDLGSTYVHGSQEKIAELFATAEREAPTVICFDEFDALVPDRSSPATQYVASEVNEFLTQLNNCSKRGIFVIGTTNRPDKIDSAVLRTGRIDRQVYIPLPDEEARKEMFAIHLQGRPFKDDDINFEKLAKLTDGYIASDIAYVVNDAALVAAFTQQDITEELLETSVANIPPSLRSDTMDFYEEMHKMMECTERKNVASQRIGFVINNNK